jgi:hypothetical protein
MANDRTALAAVRVSRAYQAAVCHMRNDAMRDPVLSRAFSYSIEMEPIRVRDSLRRYCLRYIRAYNTHCSHAATEDKCFDAARESILARLDHLCARAKLDLFAAALAQLLNCVASVSKARFGETAVCFVPCFV